MLQVVRIHSQGRQEYPHCNNMTADNLAKQGWIISSHGTDQVIHNIRHKKCWRVIFTGDFSHKFGDAHFSGDTHFSSDANFLDFHWDTLPSSRKSNKAVHLQCHNNIGMHYCYCFVSINTNTDTTFSYQYQFDPYHDTHHHIAQQGPLAHWKMETCDQDHCTPPTITASQHKTMLTVKSELFDTWHKYGIMANIALNVGIDLNIILSMLCWYLKPVMGWVIPIPGSYLVTVCIPTAF